MNPVLLVNNYSKHLHKETFKMEVPKKFTRCVRRRYRGEYKKVVKYLEPIDHSAGSEDDEDDRPFGHRPKQYVKPQSSGNTVVIHRQYQLDAIIAVPSTKERRAARMLKRQGIAAIPSRKVKMLGCSSCAGLCKGHDALEGQD